MSGRPRRSAADRAQRRIDHFRPLATSAPTARARLSAAYDWFRGAVTSERTMSAAARELARLAERADTAAIAQEGEHAA